MSDELIERLRSFANYHEDLWPTKAIGIAQVAFRNAINKITKQEETIESLQARIDALMLEFCPEDMTEEQLSNWAANQARAGECKINSYSSRVCERGTKSCTVYHDDKRAGE